MQVNVERSSGDWLGHPRGLFVLFFTEMWERFSYYGMRALLVLYMTDHLFLNAEKGQQVLGYETIKKVIAAFLRATGFTSEMTIQILASQMYGFYTGLVYLTPFFGGILADRVLGQKRSIYIGGALMAVGHFLMSIESAFFIALLFLILGNGCFKPNISVQVGSLYPKGDPRRDGAFTLFYMGINVGAFLSPLVCGTLGQKVGWHYGFGAAGVGMMLGLVMYHFGRHHLAADQFEERQAVHEPTPATSRDEWRRILALCCLCAVNIVFWAVYEQQGNTMQLFADRNTDFSVLGWEMPSTWFQSFNPLFIFIFAPALNGFWKWQHRRGGEPTSVTKMGIGSVLLGLAFIFLIYASRQLGAAEGRISILWLIAATWVLTMGELYLSPIGLSLVTKVSPARMVSMMMGMWMLSSFVGNYLSGWIGGYYEVLPKETFFTILMVMGLAAGILFFGASRPLSRMMNESRY